MQKKVALLATEAELNTGVSCAQDIMYDLRVIESMELKVKLPMLLEIDNRGTMYLKIIGVSVSGQVILKNSSSTFVS